MYEQFTKAFSQYIAKNRGPDGQPAEYGLSVEGDETTGVIAVTLVFKCGVRYCCTDWGCHVGIHRPNGWRQFRECLSDAGIKIEAKIELRIHVIVEQGAVSVSSAELASPALRACFGIASTPASQVVNRMPLKAEVHFLTRTLEHERYKEGISE